MCRIALATLVVAGFGFVGASGAFAAPANGAAIAELGHQTDQVIQVRDSCGIGRHRRFGHCVPVEAVSGGMIRPHGDQLLDGMHFAANEDDVKKLNLCTVRRCRFEVAGVEAHRRTE
jgi:hypothetical protein